MKRLLLSACLFLGLTSLTWQMVGPGAGGAFNTAMETTTGALLVGGDVGGLFRSTNRGVTWLPIGKLNSSSPSSGNSTIFDRTNVTAFGFDARTDTAVVHAGIEGGLLRSVDGGRTFHARSCDSTSGTDWIASVAVCRWHPDTVLVSWQRNFNDIVGGCIRYNTTRGIVDSTYSGQATLWRRVGTQGLPTNDRIIKLGCKPNNAQFIYALTGTDGMVDASSFGGTPRSYRLYRKRGSAGTSNTNFLGGAWTDISPGGAADSVWDFLIHPYNPDTIWATTFTGSFRAGTHTGTTWVRVHQDSTWRPISAHTGALTYSSRGPTLEPDIYTVDVVRDYSPSCTECGVWKATAATQQNAPPVSNGPFTRIETGSTWNTGWEFMQKWAFSRSERGVANTLFPSLLDTTRFYWTTSQFVFGADTLGSFQPLFTDFRRAGPATGNDVWKGRAIGNTIPLALSAAPGIIAGGWWDLGIGISMDGGRTWQMSNDSSKTAGAGGWLGHGGDCGTILVDPQKPSTIWAAQGSGKTAGNLIRSVSYGAPQSWAATAGLSNSFLYGLALDKTSTVGSRKMFVTSNGDLYRSTDDGQNWTLIWDRAVVQDSGLIAVGVQGTTVLAGGPNGLWRSTTSGVDSTGFTKVFPMPSGWTIQTSGSRYDVRHRGIHDIVWNQPGEVFVTISGSSSSTSGQELFVNAAGDSFGVYRSADYGVTWSKVHAGGVAGIGNYDDRFHVAKDGSWWVSSRSVGAGGGITRGNGIWYSSNAGRTWKDMGANLPWPSVAAVTSDPVNASWIIITALGPGVFRADWPGIGFVPRGKAR